MTILDQVAPSSRALARRPSPTQVPSGGLSARLQRASTGDAEAFADLYDLTSARVYGLARRVLRNPAQAEEVAQEAYLEIWRTSPRFDPARGSAISWMMTIVHRRAVDRVRTEESRNAREERDHRQTHLPGYADDTTSDIAFASIAAERVRAVLSLLPPPQRETLELTYFGGYTNAQVARLMDVPIGTVKSRLRSGLAQLRGLMLED